MELRIPLVLPLDSKAIEKCIPHRYPFLLVDKILELEPGKSIRGLKNVSLSDPILQGHFPSQPIYPGVLLIEAMAQTSAVLAYFSNPNPFSQILLTEVSQARFRRTVLPGDSLHFLITTEKSRGSFAWFNGQALVGQDVVASCKFSAFVK
jgi:beta-hydroxyacyl-ACP dehydratase FabZ